MKHLLLALGLLIAHVATAQKPHQPSSAEIYHSMQKLDVLGNVLYLAAHPDDENTRFIAYCANEKLFNTAYLSLTRGDGGQNLIGPEISEELGIIRTQELLAARRIDGGRQFFARAIDFGYSKTSTETQTIWNRDKVLSDVVWVIRKFRPDVIVLRFPPDSRGGHGHHTASAELGIEAFELAADPTAYPEQLETVQTWQATRIVTNTGRWWRTDISADEEGVTAEDVGQYVELLGSSCNEIAARSRSQHKSQGFGATGKRGEQLEYFELHKGKPADKSLFEGLNTSWARVKGSEAVQRAVRKTLSEYKFENPAASVPNLLAVRTELIKLGDNPWAVQKLRLVEKLIKHCCGLYLEATATDYAVTPGDSLTVNLELTNRSNTTITLTQLTSPQLNIDNEYNLALGNNQQESVKIPSVLPKTQPYSQPYWLVEKGKQGIYTVNNRALIGTPENAPAVHFTATLTISGQTMDVVLPVVYKWNDPVKGELYRPLAVTPPVFINFAEPIHIFTSQPRTIELVARAGRANFEGELTLAAPAGWTLSQKTWPLSFAQKGEELRLTVTLTPGDKPTNGPLDATVTAKGRSYNYALRTLSYEHIPTQVWFPEASTKLAYIDLKTNVQKVGYISGAGDNVPAALRNIGIEVTELTESDITQENLAQYQTILLGIRALNTNERISYILPALFKYVNAGGTVVIQYNTAHRLKTDQIGPYPIKLSRDRVTEEDAAVTFLLPDHPLMNTPNKISQADFDGWVQERGLYFPNEWDEKYDALLSWHDKGEEAKTGALLATRYGDGHFVYTGISFFRELPAGVPGAFRLLANIISYGHK